MTAAARAPEAEFNGNGTTKAFPAQFRFLPGTLTVDLIDAAGLVTRQTENVDYTVSGGTTDAGGTVTMTVAPSVGTQLRIRRATPRAQTAAYSTTDEFPAETHEGALDKAMLIDQEQDVALAALAMRALRLPDGEAAVDLAPAAVRKGLLLGFDEFTGALTLYPRQGEKGDPGGDALNIGLLAEADGLAIPAGVTRVHTTGHHVVGVGAAWYHHDEAFDLLAWPTMGFVAADGRKFRLDTANQDFTPQNFGVPADGSDPTAVLQAYFDFMVVNAVPRPFLSGSFTVTSTIQIGQAGVSSATRRFSGATFALTAGAPMAHLLRMQRQRSAQFSLRFQFRGVAGGGSAAYSSRTQCAIGLYIEDCRQVTIDAIFAQGFWYAGVHASNPGGTNNNFVTINTIETDYCGSGNTGSGQSLTTSYSSPANSGAAASTSQYTSIDVGTNPLSALNSATGFASTNNNFQVRIAGELYTIVGQDGPNRIRIFPWLNADAPSSGTLTYVWGGAVSTRGEANVWQIGMLEARNGGRGASFGALYGPTIQVFSSQDNGQGVCFGREPSAAHRGTHIMNFYTESDDEPMVFCNRFGGNNSGRVSSTFSLGLSDITVTGQARGADNSRSMGSSIIDRWTIAINGIDVEP